MSKVTVVRADVSKSRAPGLRPNLYRVTVEAELVARSPADALMQVQDALMQEPTSDE